MKIFIIIHSVYNVRVICVSMETDQKDKNMHVKRKQDSQLSDHNMKTR